MSRLTRVLFASLVALAAAGPASAAPGWVPHEEGTERTSHTASNPLVGIADTGEVVSAWARFDPGEGATVVEARIRPAGGPLGPVVRLSPAGPSANSPDLAVGADGRAIVVWSQDGDIRAAVRPPGGGFGGSQAFPDGANEVSGQTSIGLDAAGNAIVVWTSSNSVANTTLVRKGAIPVGGAPTGTQLVRTEPTPVMFTQPKVAVDDSGRAHAVWVRVQLGAGTRTTTIQRAYSPAGGPLAYGGDLDTKFENPFNNELPQGVEFPQVAIDATGEGVAIWMRVGSPNAVRWSAGAAGGAFSPPVNLPGGEPWGDAELAMNAAGEAIVAGTPKLVPRAIRIHRRPRGGVFGAPQTISEPGSLIVSDAAIGDGGEAAVAWIDLADGGYQARAAYHPGGGAGWVQSPIGPFASVQYSGTMFASAALDDAGNAAFAWSLGGIDTFRSAIGGYDAEGPRFGPIDLPATVERGVRFDATAAASDVWSTPVISWAFNGLAKAGGPVQHTFPKIGTFDVALSSTDALGNVSGTTRQVKVIDTVRPRLGRVRMARKRFAVGGGRRVRSSARARRGSAFRFRLNEAARVRIRIDRRLRGRHKRTAAFTRRNRSAGANRIRFTGRIRRRALRPGRYRATVRAIDPAGNRSAPRRVQFRVVRGR